MKSLFLSFCDWLTEAAKIFLGSCVAAIVLITLAAVWQRYVVDNPLSWIEQVSNMIFIWIIFIGSAVLYRQNLHIGVDAFLMSLSGKNKDMWKWVIECFNLTFIVVLFVYSLKLTISVWDNTDGALDITPASYYAAAPFSCAMMIIYFIEKIFDPTKREPVGEVGEF